MLQLGNYIITRVSVSQLKIVHMLFVNNYRVRSCRVVSVVTNI